jgi:cellulose synthase (UDP-forming)/cellulose synthase operon protein B
MKRNSSSATLSPLPAWRVAGLAVLMLVGSMLIWSAASAQLTAAQQTGLAVATMMVFLVANRFPGRAVTMFLVMLSVTVSLRYIVWRVTETLEFNTVLQGALGIILALAEAYAATVLGTRLCPDSVPAGAQAGAVAGRSRRLALGRCLYPDL